MTKNKTGIHCSWIQRSSLYPPVKSVKQTRCKAFIHKDRGSFILPFTCKNRCIHFEQYNRHGLQLNQSRTDRHCFYLPPCNSHIIPVQFPPSCSVPRWSNIIQVFKHHTNTHNLSSKSYANIRRCKTIVPLVPWLCLTRTTGYTAPLSTGGTANTSYPWGFKEPAETSGPYLCLMLVINDALEVLFTFGQIQARF